MKANENSICNSRSLILVVALLFGLKLGEQLPNPIWNFFFFFAFELIAQDAADRPQGRLPLDLLFFSLRHVG